MAWRDWTCGEAWCAPMPFNWIISGARRIWYGIKHGVCPHKLAEAEGLVTYYRNKYYDECTESVRLRAGRAK